MKGKKMKSAAQATRSSVALDALLRGGGGKHGDRRTKRQRTRSAQRAFAIRDAA
jgi:hypothetical protein